MNKELQSLTAAAYQAKSAYDKALKMSQELGQSSLDIAWLGKLKKDFHDCVTACRQEAGFPAQGDFADALEVPAEWVVDKVYRRTETGNCYFFVSDEDNLEFYSPLLGTMQVSHAWAKTNMVPATAEQIETFSLAIAMGESEDWGDEKLTVKRVSPERFEELRRAYSGESLAAPERTARAIEMISDVSYVVTMVGEDRLLLEPCYPLGTEEADNLFQFEGESWRIGAAEDRIIVRMAPVEVIVSEAEPVRADPLEWLKNWVARGFAETDEMAQEGAGEKYVDLAPSSFAALKAQVAPELSENLEDFWVEAAGCRVYRSESDGMDIDGYEQPEAEELPGTIPDLSDETEEEEAGTDELEGSEGE